MFAWKMNSTIQMISGEVQTLGSQSGKVQNKRISFQEDINRNSKIFDQSVIESAKAQNQIANELDINQIQEDTKEDITVSSISSQPLGTI